MVSHNIVNAIEKDVPSSLSKNVNKLLRNELNFSGVIITDGINMGALQEEYSIEETINKAILAGNDMIIVCINKNTQDKISKSKITYERIIKSVESGLKSGIISEEMIEKAVNNVLAWKYMKGLL